MVQRRAKLAPDLPVSAPVITEDADVKTKARGKRRGRNPCGFCNDVNQVPKHDLCPVIINNADQSTPDKTWHCICAEDRPEIHHRTRGF